MSRFVTKGRLCISAAPPAPHGDIVGSHVVASGFGCGMGWSPKRDAEPLSSLWESALNAQRHDSAAGEDSAAAGARGNKRTGRSSPKLSSEILDQLKPARKRPAATTCAICLEDVDEDRLNCHGCSMVAHPRCLLKWFSQSGGPSHDPFPAMAMADDANCPQCRRKLDWNSMVESMRLAKKGRYAEAELIANAKPKSKEVDGATRARTVPSRHSQRLAEQKKKSSWGKLGAFRGLGRSQEGNEDSFEDICQDL